MIGIVHTPKKQADSRSNNPVVMLLVVSVIIFALGMVFNMATSFKKSNLNYIVLDIQSGDTVWSLVRKVYGEEAEIRGAVRQTLEINGLSEGIIQPGTTIKIPRPVNLESAEAMKTI